MSVVTDRNANAVNNIISANKMMNTTVQGVYGSYDKTKLCTIAHVSDLHNDNTRYSNYLNFVKDVSMIDHYIASGDIVDVPILSQFSNMMAQESAASVFPIKCVGNHEKYAGGEFMSNADIYTNLNLNTNTGKLYYYVDDAAYNIRFVVLDQYDIDQSTGRTEHLTQDQIDFFVNALQGALTNDYSVVVVMHVCESGGSFPEIKNKYMPGVSAVFDYEGNSLNGSVSNNFYQRFKQWEGLTDTINVCSGTPIEDIINAFQNAGTINETYTFSDTSTSITVNATFASAGTFIAYLTGHTHGDFIGKSSKYPNQLYLTVNTGNVNYGNVSDLERISGTKSEDCFNVYVIDQTHKLVKVVRVGADVNDIMEARKTSIYNY